jgi:sodium pump decarboxylase gamma subunit
LIRLKPRFRDLPKSSKEVFPLNDLSQALTIGLLGMGLTFAALALLLLVIVALNRVLSAPRIAARETQAVRPATSAAHAGERELEEEEIAVAIAIALSHLRSLDICRAGLGARLEAGRGRWWGPTSLKPPIKASIHRERS